MLSEPRFFLVDRAEIQNFISPAVCCLGEEEELLVLRNLNAVWEDQPVEHDMSGTGFWVISQQPPRAFSFEQDVQMVPALVAMVKHKS
jgi:hypothetical protein